MTLSELRRWLAWPPLAIVALAVVTFALVACSGGDDDETPSGSNGGATVEATTGSNGGNGGDRLHLSSPDSLQSYRYAMTMTMSAAAMADDAPDGLPLDGDFTIEVTGEVINPDRERTTTAMDLGFIAINAETVRIGDREWVRMSGGAWEETVPGGGDMFGLELTPDTFFGTDDDFTTDELVGRLEALGSTDETVNGIAARRFTFTGEEFADIFESSDFELPADLDGAITVDLWIARELGIPVQMILVGLDTAGAEILRLELRITDLNATFEIEPPI